jgi:hypothetical protein
MEFLTRRELLGRCTSGFGALAFAHLMRDVLRADETTMSQPLAPRAPHFAPRARRVIHLFMNGGPSQVDTFDPKPLLAKHAGQLLPKEVHLKTENPTGKALPSPFKFRKCGQSGIEVSEIYPKLGECIDDICLIRSMQTDTPNHALGLMMMNTGEPRQVRPSVGSWVTYGLGTENQNLPGFIALCPGGLPYHDSQNWQSGFLPGIFQGTHIDTKHTEIEKLVENIKNARLTMPQQRKQLDLLLGLNQKHQQKRREEAQIEARLQSFEMAYRMQVDAVEAFDLSKEPKHIHDLYGTSTTQGRQMLIARRLLEHGVRFVQAWTGSGLPWDCHEENESTHRKLGRETDQPIAALLRDLKQRGMLEDTLVVWGGEFGRTPTIDLIDPANPGKLNGRDHDHHGFTMWLAGGGVKGGHVHGRTDDFGYGAVEGKVHVHDLHATLLHLLGFDHEQFTYRYAGRDFRLTDVHGHVVNELLA